MKTIISQFIKTVLQIKAPGRFIEGIHYDCIDLNDFGGPLGGAECVN